MAQNETWLNHDMLQAVKVKYLDGNLFSQDNAGNLIGVNLTRDGEEYSGGGSVSASVVRSDGGTVAVVGSLSGNVATVVLPQAAYAVVGTVSIVIKLTASGEVATIAALVANVYRSTTDTVIDPGTIIPSIDTLIAQINAAVASIPADYSALWASLAPAFSTSTAYVAGQYVTYNGGVYRFTANHSAGSWASGDVVAVDLGGEITSLKSAIELFAGVENQIVFEVAYGESVTKDVLIKAGTRLSITGGADLNGGKISFTYADGTSVTTIQIRTGINYRAEKDIVQILIYNGDNTTYTYTITIYESEVQKTNYFDKSTKISGYITNNGSIASGAYHSDFIPVALGDTIVASAYPGTFGTAQVFFYDANKTYKGRRSGTLREDGLYTFTIPLSTIGSTWTIGDVYYAAINTTEAGAETTKFYINGVPDLPLEYGQVQPESKLFFNAQQKSFIETKETNAKSYSDAQLAEIVTHETSVNLFNRNDPLTEENTIWQNSGKKTLSGYITTHPIPVSTGDVLLFSASTSDLYGNFAAYVTADKTFISKISTPSSTTQEGYTQITANRDGYISFNCGSGKSTTLMITKNADMPESYDPYVDEYVFTEKVNVGSLSGDASPLKHKLIAYNGDSICESRLQETSSYNGGAYAKIIADIVDGSYENRAISGGILASAPGDGGSTPSRCVVTDVTNMTDDADLICFEGGINDYWRKVPLGTYSESDYTGTLDTTTICGALESIFRQAQEKWLGKPIVFIITHKITSTVYTQNTAGYTWMEVHEKMIGICNKYSIPYYDAFVESGLNGYVSVQSSAFLTANSSGTGDGCHPNETGYRRYYVPQLIKLFESLMPRLSE